MGVNSSTDLDCVTLTDLCRPSSGGSTRRLFPQTVTLFPRHTTQVALPSVFGDSACIKFSARGDRGLIEHLQSSRKLYGAFSSVHDSNASIMKIAHDIIPVDCLGSIWMGRALSSVGGEMSKTDITDAMNMNSVSLARCLPGHMLTKRCHLNRKGVK